MLTWIRLAIPHPLTEGREWANPLEFPGIDQFTVTESANLGEQLFAIASQFDQPVVVTTALEQLSEQAYRLLAVNLKLLTDEKTPHIGWAVADEFNGKMEIQKRSFFQHPERGVPQKRPAWKLFFDRSLLKTKSELQDFLWFPEVRPGNQWTLSYVHVSQATGHQALDLMRLWELCIQPFSESPNA